MGWGEATRPAKGAGSARPIVLIDMDGPLAHFDQHFFAVCESEQITVEATLHTQTARFATDHIPDKRERAWIRNQINTTSWFRNLPVVEGAVEGMERLAEDADVWICTKPLEVNPTCRDDKAKWLAEHFGSHWLERLIIAPDKSMVYGDILLDDAPKLDWLEKDHLRWEPVIYPTPYNSYGSEWGHLRAWTWGQPIEWLLGDHVRP